MAIQYGKPVVGYSHPQMQQVDFPHSFAPSEYRIHFLLFCDGFCFREISMHTVFASAHDETVFTFTSSSILLPITVCAISATQINTFPLCACWPRDVAAQDMEMAHCKDLGAR